MPKGKKRQAEHQMDEIDQAEEDIHIDDLDNAQQSEEEGEDLADNFEED